MRQKSRYSSIDYFNRISSCVHIVEAPLAKSSQPTTVTLLTAEHTAVASVYNLVAVFSSARESIAFPPEGIENKNDT